MAEVIEWRDGVVRATRDLTPAIRLIEIEPKGEFVAASPGSHINVSVMIRGRPDIRSYSIVGPCAGWCSARRMSKAGRLACGAPASGADF